MMLTTHHIMPLNFLKKSRFTGSHLGMRFLLRKQTVEEDGAQQTYLEAITWPEPFCFEASDPNTHNSAQFPFSDEGIGQAVDWLNRQHEEHYSS